MKKCSQEKWHDLIFFLGGGGGGSQPTIQIFTAEITRRMINIPGILPENGHHCFLIKPVEIEGTEQQR